MIVDVALFPFTTEVKVFIAEDKLFVVLDATRFVRSVVVDTPFTEVVRLLPLVERSLLLMMVEVEVTPLTFVVNVFVAEVISLLLITLLVATTPFTVVVNVLPDRDCVNELMNCFIPEEIPLMIFSKSFPVVEATLLLIIVEVEITPLTFVVNVFVAEVISLLLITDVVATTPFTFVVSTFPVTLCVNELMMLVTVDEIPLIIVWNRLPLDDAVAELMIVEVATTPFTALVSMFVAEDNEFVVVDTKPAIDVVETTPFILEVTTPPA